MSKNLYLCSCCRKQIASVEEALYVDQSTNRPFCSEECILEFHAAYMESFEREELEQRQLLGLDPEMELDELYHRHDLFQEALNAPEEIWFEKNPLGEEFITHIGRVSEGGAKLYYILVCSYFADAPSFVFFKCLTRHSKLADFYRSGERKTTVETPKEFKEFEEAPQAPEEALQEIEIPQQTMEDLELKKSEYLAALLESRSENDIPFEEFSRFDDYMPSTIEDPDEVYESEDESGDEIRTYIKSFQVAGKAFFYVVVCMKVELEQAKEAEALLPVLGFPSDDQELYRDYAVGERVSGALKN